MTLLRLEIRVESKSEVTSEKTRKGTVEDSVILKSDMELATLYWFISLLFNMVTLARMQIQTSASHFEKTFGSDQRKPNEIEPIFKPEFFQCDRDKSCTDVVLFKNGKYGKIRGTAIVMEDVTSVWKKYSREAQSQQEKPGCAEVKEIRTINGVKVKPVDSQESSAEGAVLDGRDCAELYQWSPLTDPSKNSHLQFDFGDKMMVVTKIEVKDCLFYKLTETFQLSYSTEKCEKFKEVEKMSHTSKKENSWITELSKPIKGKCVRISAVDKQTPAWKVDLYGCEG